MDTIQDKKDRKHQQKRHNLHTTATHRQSEERDGQGDKPRIERSDRSNHTCHTLRTEPRPGTPEEDKVLQPDREEMRKTRGQEGNGDTIRTMQDRINDKNTIRVRNYLNTESRRLCHFVSKNVASIQR